MAEQDAIVKDQLQFITWLKANKLYNPMEDARTMRRMFEVWKAMRGENL